jgi:DNA-binding NtrC family response regulator
MSGEKRILIVDDEIVIADSLARVFSINGYDSKAAYSVEGAIQAVSEWTPHLAIVDVCLKKVFGVTLAVLLREKFPSCQIALFSGEIALYSEMTYLSDLSEGAQDAGHSFEVIFKPIHPKEILRIAARKLANLEEGEFCIA